MKKTLIVISFLFCISLYAQTGEVIICEGMQGDNFINTNVTVVKSNFVWYFYRYDYQNIGFTSFTQRLINLETGITNDYKGASPSDTPCLYFIDKLERGRWKIIMLDIHGKLIGQSKEFEVK